MEVFRYGDGVIPDSCAIGYTLIGYPLAVYGLSQGNVLLYFLSVLLLAHTLVIAAYLLHECIHQTIFRSSKHSEWMGLLLSWITGACYARYSDLKKKHLRHHANRIDSLAIDHQKFLSEHTGLRKVVMVLQWLHIPAIELLTHGLSMAAPFLLESRHDQRVHCIAMLASRIGFFITLLLWDWRILPGYAIAYLIFLQVLGFMDTFQHCYQVRINLEQGKLPPEFDRAYEEAHTWSNLISERYPWLNLLVLNFCYHNVHHYKSGEPWYRLPRLHRERYYKEQSPNISLKKQLRDFHQYRMCRVTDATHPDQQINPGAAGVSFLAGV